MNRCPCCGARDFHPSPRCYAIERDDWRECSHCGLLTNPQALANGALCRALDEAFDGDRFVVSADAPFFVESYALRTLALSRRLVARSAEGVQNEALRSPYTMVPAIAALCPVQDLPVLDVSLVVLCRAHDLCLIQQRFPSLLETFDDIVLLVDANGNDDGLARRAFIAPVPRTFGASGDLRIVFRPLAGDFAQQRNIGQVLARHDWVLQIDADETLDRDTLASVGRVAALAQKQGMLSVGLPRRNLVDDVLSDLYPDIQYRLNHRKVVFHGRVHERPNLPRGWRDSFIAPNLVITHHLSAAHVALRSRNYEMIVPNKGRLDEEIFLSTPFRA